MTLIAESCSLFEIDTELDALLEQIEEQVEAEGEPSEALVSRFREFCTAHGEKVDRIGRFVRMMEAREQYCRAEAARLGERARSTAAKVDRTKTMVLFYLMSRELKKIEGHEFTLRIQKNSQDSVRVLDEPALPMAYRKVDARISGVLWETILSHLQTLTKAVLQRRLPRIPITQPTFLHSQKSSMLSRIESSRRFEALRANKDAMAF
jgi:hypothetical protein